MGKRDVHILLSPSVNPNDSVHLYEIIIGKLNNSQMLIRKQKSGVKPLYIQNKKDILFEDEPNEIRVIISKGI